MPESMKVKKEDMERVRKNLIDSVRFIEEIEFKQGVEEGRRQVREGETITLQKHEKQKRG